MDARMMYATEKYEKVSNRLAFRRGIGRTEATLDVELGGWECGGVAHHTLMERHRGRNRSNVSHGEC
jgi:hypothetical protein